MNLLTVASCVIQKYLASAKAVCKILEKSTTKMTAQAILPHGNPPIYDGFVVSWLTLVFGVP